LASAALTRETGVSAPMVPCWPVVVSHAASEVAPRLISTFQVFVASCTKPVGLS
jgi:hypothetical protein